MMTKFTITNIAIRLANAAHVEQCEKMDKIIDDCLGKAFEGEKISKERATRIVDRFVKLMLEVKYENISL